MSTKSLTPKKPNQSLGVHGVEWNHPGVRGRQQKKTRNSGPPLKQSAAMLRLLPPAMLVLLSFGMLGCKTVQPVDLVGIWLIKDSSRQILPPELQKAIPNVVVEANGTFVVSDMPGLFYIPGRRAARLESGSGVWKLVSREAKQQLQLEFRAIANWKETDLPYGTQLDVTRRWPAVRLSYFLGDADEGGRIDFEKK
jgi:hypothetical protein